MIPRIADPAITGLPRLLKARLRQNPSSLSLRSGPRGDRCCQPRPKQGARPSRHLHRGKAPHPAKSANSGQRMPAAQSLKTSYRLRRLRATAVLCNAVQLCNAPCAPLNVLVAGAVAVAQLQPHSQPYAPNIQSGIAATARSETHPSNVQALTQQPSTIDTLNICTLCQ